MDIIYQKAFSYDNSITNKKMPSTDLPKKEEKKENTNTLSAEPSHSFGPDFSYIMNNKITIPTSREDVRTVEEKSKRGRKKKTNIDGVITEGNVNKSESSSEEPYSKVYEETTNMLKASIMQLDAGLSEMQQDVSYIRASKTLKRKYEYLSDIHGTMGQYIGNKISALREINNSISKCNELELKRAKELHAQQGEENTDKAVMDMYSAFISMPTDMNPGMSLGPSVNQLTYSPAITGAVTQTLGGDEEAGYNNFLNNMTPAQRLSMYESDPNVQQVVIYDNTTNSKRFEVMNIATGEIIPNVDKRDMMFMDDTVIDLQNHIARNLNLNETYPVIEVGERLSDVY